LQEVQDAQGYVSKESVIALVSIAAAASKVFVVATFYNQFRFHPAAGSTCRCAEATGPATEGIAVVCSIP